MRASYEKGLSEAASRAIVATSSSSDLRDWVMMRSMAWAMHNSEGMDPEADLLSLMALADARALRLLPADEHDRYEKWGRDYAEKFGALIRCAKVVDQADATQACTKPWATQFYLRMIDVLGLGFHPDTAMVDYIIGDFRTFTDYEADVMERAYDRMIKLAIDEYMIMDLQRLEEGFSDPDDPIADEWHKAEEAKALALVKDAMEKGFDIVPGIVIRAGHKQAENDLFPEYAAWYVLDQRTDIVGEGDSVAAAIDAARAWLVTY